VNVGFNFIDDAFRSGSIRVIHPAALFVGRISFEHLFVE